jgi:hypothetical protein
MRHAGNQGYSETLGTRNNIDKLHWIINDRRDTLGCKAREIHWETGSEEIHWKPGSERYTVNQVKEIYTGNQEQ